MNGPFGHYTGQTVGVILNTMYTQEKIPLRIVESVTVGNGEIFYGGEKFGEYKFLGYSDQLVFRWKEETYNRQRYYFDDDEGVNTQVDFRLQLLDNMGVGIIIDEPRILTEEFERFVFEYLFTNLPGQQPMSIESFEKGKRFVIKCLNESRAQELVTYLNNGDF